MPEVITKAIWSSIDRVPSCRATVSLAELMIKPHKVKNASLEVPTVRKMFKRSQEEKGKKDTYPETLEGSDLSEIQEMIKFRDFKEGFSAKRHLRDSLWIANFLQLENKQMERLFPLTTGSLMGCHWLKEEENVAIGSCRFLKMSVRL